MLKIVRQRPFLLDAGGSEGKAAGLSPNSVFGGRLSRDRWLVVFVAKGYTGVDDTRSVHYRLHAGGPDGLLLRSGILQPSIGAWRSPGIAEPLFKAHGHPTFFGVPRGAMLNGSVYPNHNRFAAVWYAYGKRIEDGRHVLDPDIDAATVRLEWAQFELNDAGDDITILQPPEPLREAGHEQGPAVCGAGFRNANHWVSGAVPRDVTCREWLECIHGEGTIAVAQYMFDPASGRYRWTRTGPKAQSPYRLGEASLCRLGPAWLIAARSNRWTRASGDHTAWMRCADPLEVLGDVAFRAPPATYGPRTCFVCADGNLRIFSGDWAASPRKEKRNPLYCWEVAPEDFTCGTPQVVFDAHAAGLDLREPFADFAILFPVQGNRQLLTFRVTVPNWTVASDHGPAIRPEELAVSGSYAVELEYESKSHDQWSFADESRAVKEQEFGIRSSIPTRKGASL